MLQTKHLAIVRAALKYWHEEMGSVSHDVYRHYLHSRDRELELSLDDIVSARAYFTDVNHKYGVLDVASGTLLPTTLTEDGQWLACSSNQKIVSVLIH